MRAAHLVSKNAKPCVKVCKFCCPGLPRLPKLSQRKYIIVSIYIHADLIEELHELRRALCEIISGRLSYPVEIALIGKQ